MKTAPNLIASAATGTQPPATLPVHPIDAVVARRLAGAGLVPAARCSDAEFLRRVCIDFSGALPGAAKAREFLADPSPSAVKRARLVEWVFNRPEFAEYWAMRWGDVLRIKSEFPSNLWPNAVQAYHAWLRDAFAEDRSFALIVRELLTTAGSNFRRPASNFYRAVARRVPDAIAAQVALAFMGIRLEAGSSDADGFAAFFTNVRYKTTGEWKEEIVLFADDWRAVRDPRTGSVVRAKFPFEKQPLFPVSAPAGAAALQSTAGGNGAPRRSKSPTFAREKKPAGKNADAVAERAERAAKAREAALTRYPAGADPQKLVADWLTAPANPWFGANFANRTWATLFGRGITEPVDAAGPANPPAVPELLDLLVRHLRANNYSLRALLRFIATSETYQRSWHRTDTERTPRLSASPAARTSSPLLTLARRVPRRLEAEVLADAIGSLTGAYEKFESRIPEPLAFWPENFRAVQNPDASVTTSFLDTFGRPARDTAFANERDISPSMAQAVWLLNSRALNAKIEKRGGGVAALVRAHSAPAKHAALADELYLALLARFPTDAERAAVLRHLHDDTAGTAAGSTLLTRTQDIVWALINTKEFLYN